MPAINSVFHFLKQTQYCKEGNRLQAKTAQRDHGTVNYYMVLLPRVREHIEIAVNNYTILAPHLTIFEDFQSYSINSEFHFTANLRDETGKSCVLHCYFGVDDKLKFDLKEITRTLNIATNKYEVQELHSIPLSESDSFSLESMVHQYCLDTLKNLRTTHQMFIEETVKKFNPVYEELLALPTNDKETILSCLRKLEQLKPESEKLKQIGCTRNYLHELRSYQDRLEWKYADFLAENNDQTTPEIEPVVDSTSHILTQLSGQTKKPSKIIASTFQVAISPSMIEEDKQKRKFIELEAEVAQLAATCRPREDAATTEPTLDTLLQFHDVAQTAMLDVWDYHGKDSQFMQNARRLETYWIESKNQCTQRLKQAIKEDILPDIVRLSQFIQYVSEEDLFSSIILNKPHQTELFLKHGNFPINRIAVRRCVLSEDNAAQGASLSNTSQDTITLLELAYHLKNVACFKLLLEQGASVWITKEFGLPFAYYIENDRSNPCAEELAVYFRNQTKWYAKQMVSLLGTVPPFHKNDLFNLETIRIIYQSKLEQSERNTYSISAANARQQYEQQQTFNQNFKGISTSQLTTFMDSVSSMRNMISTQDPKKSDSNRKQKRPTIEELRQRGKETGMVFTPQTIASFLDLWTRDPNYMLELQSIQHDIARYDNKTSLTRKEMQEVKALQERAAKFSDQIFQMSFLNKAPAQAKK